MAGQARTIRIPVHMVEAVSKLARARRQLLPQDLGREPTPAELDITLEKIIEVQEYGREPISPQTPLGEDGDSEFGDLIEDSEATQPGEAVSFTLLQEQLHSVLGTLSEREAGVVSMRFGLTGGQPKTLDEIGKVLRGHPGADPADRVQDQGPPGLPRLTLPTAVSPRKQPAMPVRPARGRTEGPNLDGQRRDRHRAEVRTRSAEVRVSASAACQSWGRVQR